MRTKLTIIAALLAGCGPAFTTEEPPPEREVVFVERGIAEYPEQDVCEELGENARPWAPDAGVRPTRKP